MEQTTNTKEAKVYQLCQELEDMKDKKKQSSKSFNTEIKRLQDEIKELLDDELEEDKDI
jgi:HPt (histidine-containing phosphotransfer) domain-containing protein